MLPEVDDYYWTMAARGRLLQAYESGHPGVYCTFFVLPSLDDVRRFYPRGYWTTPDDLKDGPVIFIDKLFGQRMDRNIWRCLEFVITQRVPSWQVAVWYRPTSHGPDRRYTYYRRGGGQHGPHV